MCDNDKLKGILKTGSNSQYQKRQATFDEMNVLATHHPLEKDYGHMKIDEAKTPYHYGDDDTGAMDCTPVDSNELFKRLKETKNEVSSYEPKENTSELPENNKSLEKVEPEENSDNPNKFEMLRKQHYNMKEVLKKSRQMMKEEDNEN